MALYDLREKCKYGDRKEEMIRNCLVVSNQDDALLESLQTDLKLMLETTKTKSQQKEAVCEQQQTFQGAETQPTPSAASMPSATSDREPVVIPTTEAKDKR